MQQFTVPQFIDVESKIIGPITTRQFMIFLASAIVIAICYRILDFSLFLTVTVIIVAFASIFAFVKINGRPFHFFVLNLLQTIRRPGLRIWNNRAVVTEIEEKTPVVKAEPALAAKEQFKSSRLAELSLVVDTKGKYKGE